MYYVRAGCIPLVLPNPSKKTIWVAAEELKLSYHDRCVYIYKRGFPQYSNLNPKP